MNPYAMPKIGDVVAGKYRLEKVAGEGGMGVVYAAEHLVLRQRVAVKVLLPSGATSEAVVERFAREAQAAARIQSEHVARVMDAGSLASGAPFLVMEYLEGCDLEELLALQNTLPVNEVADYMLQALEALAHAHAVGIVHRDLKPANLFLAARPDGSTAIKMLDFGISKATQARPEDKVLTGHAVLGSPVYMSPEQLRNAKEIDGRADLWSLGVVAYELACGKPPFDGEGVGEIFAAILEKTAVPLHLRQKGVGIGFSSVVERCLARDVRDRWADAAELARAVAPHATGGVRQWGDVVARIEQVLTRARMLNVQPTPYEIRQVELAIASAAEGLRSLTRAGIADRRAKTEPLERGDAIAPSSKTVAMRTLRRTLRRPAARWAGFVAGASVVALVLVSILMMRARASADEPLGSLGSLGPKLAATEVKAAPLDEESVSPPSPEPSGEPTARAAALEEVSADAPAAPAVKSAPSRGSKPRTSKPQRPKFLNSRE